MNGLVVFGRVHLSTTHTVQAFGLVVVWVWNLVAWCGVGRVEAHCWVLRDQAIPTQTQVIVDR